MEPFAVKLLVPDTCPQKEAWLRAVVEREYAAVAEGDIDKEKNRRPHWLIARPVLAAISANQRCRMAIQALKNVKEQDSVQG